MAFVAPLLAATLIGFGLWLALVDRQWALYLVVFLAPWHGLDLDVGLRVTAYQIALIPLILVTVSHMAVRGWKKYSSPGYIFLATFVVYAISRSLLAVPFLPAADISGGFFRGPEVRAISQIVMFCFSLSPIFLLPDIL